MGLGSMTTLKEPSESGAGSEEGLQGRLAKDPEGTGLKLLQSYLLGMKSQGSGCNRQISLL